MAKAGPAKRTTPSNWREIFLARLAQTSNVAAAARTARIDTAKVYKARRSEPDFYARWMEALAEGYDNLEMDLLRRLRTGELTGGGPAKVHRKYDNAIALRLLSAHRESVSRQKAMRADHDEDAIIAAINDKLETIRQRQLARKAADGDEQ